MGGIFTCCCCPKDDDDEEPLKPSQPEKHTVRVAEVKPRLSSKSSSSSVTSKDNDSVKSVKSVTGYHESTPLLKEPRISSTSTQDATPSSKKTALKKVEKVVKIAQWTHGKRDKHSAEGSTDSKDRSASAPPQTTSGAVAQSHEAVIERGHNIARTEEASEDMAGHAHDFGETMKALAELQRKKSEKKKRRKSKKKSKSSSSGEISD